MTRHPPSEDSIDTVEITVRVSRQLHETAKAFFAEALWFTTYDEIVGTLLQAMTCRPDGPAAQRSFLDLLAFTAEQRGISFEENLFGRDGNEHDRRQFYGLMLGMERLRMVNDYEWSEMKEKGAARFAHDVARRFARDLNRIDGQRLIEGMTLGSPQLQAEMLHWLDVFCGSAAPCPRNDDDEEIKE
jgi:hypothetical protein